MRRGPRAAIAAGFITFTAAATLSLGVPALAAGHGYVQAKLTADQAGQAQVTDAKLVNAWGITEGPTTPIWINDNHSGFSTVYNAQGHPFPASSPIAVTIPPSASEPSGTVASPTGIVFNGTSGFVVKSGSVSGAAKFIFATEDGTISGWNSAVDATHAVNEFDGGAKGDVLKGLAIATNAADTDIYATDFHNGAIRVFKQDWTAVTPSGGFTDPNLPAGFAPFGIQNLGGKLYVTYAKQLAPDNHDDQAGPGNGYVDAFDVNGTLLKRVISGGQLNSPWGLTVAPSTFGDLAGDLLVGNFGDGKINAFDATTGAFKSDLDDAAGAPIVTPGLWGLMFGNGSANGGNTNTLYVTAGPNGESNGLFAAIDVAPAPTPSPAAVALPHSGGVAPAGGRGSGPGALLLLGTIAAAGAVGLGLRGGRPTSATARSSSPDQS